MTLTYLAIRQWLQKGRKIYSNYTLFGVPFTKVDSIPDIQNMEFGFACLDELWLWIDSRASLKLRNTVTAGILLKSRKRGLTIGYTTQSFDQVDKRVRKITDFIAYPILSVGNTYCKVVIFRGPRPSVAGIVDRIYFNPFVVYQAYNSNEEIGILKEKDDVPMKEEYYELESNPVLKQQVF